MRVGVISQELPDYYAVLQVHPDADQAVIEAAYRQLMKKHHPDVAGDDSRRAAENHRRATKINRAFAVLRDPAGRRKYDLMRQVTGARQPPTNSSAAHWRPAPAASAPDWHTRSAEPATQRGGRTNRESEQPADRGWGANAEPAAVYPPTLEVAAEASLPPPLSWLATAYFLLPGPYEWERGTGREVVGVLLLPVVGTAAFALVTGRLAPLLGHSLGATLTAWLAVGVLSVPLLHALPRVAVACGPSVVLLTGALNPTFTQAHFPLWLAWAATAMLALVLAARIYVFGFLPTLAICWLLSRT